MTSRLLRPVASLCAIVCLLSPERANAQRSRTALVDSAQAMIDNFNEQQSIVVLQRALDPALGAPDAPWTRGVQLLAQTLLQTNQGAQARAWLRWAIRLSPSFQVDNVIFTPQLVAAAQEARRFVSQANPEPRAGVRFEWSTTLPSDGSGVLRVERAGDGQARELQLSIDNIGTVALGNPRRLAAGSYRMVARATGIADAAVTTEVLPGVTTVVTLALAPSVVAAGVLEPARERVVLANVARIDAAAGGEPSCGTGAFVGAQRLLMTRYRTIRGAEQLSVHVSGGRLGTDGVGIAGYDVNADLALLAVPSGSGEALQLGGSVSTGDNLWAVRYTNCGATPTLSSVHVAAVNGNAVSFTGGALGDNETGVLVDMNGAVVGLVTGATSARALGAAQALVEAGAQNAASGSLMTVSQVALREKHAIGTVELTSSVAGAQARVTPKESWQWRDAARTDALPFTFRGPMGRYEVEVVNGDKVISSTEIDIEPGTSRQVALNAQKKGRSLLLPILGGLAAGGVVAALAGGGKKDGPPNPPPVTTGGIVVRLP